MKPVLDMVALSTVNGATGGTAVELAGGVDNGGGDDSGAEGGVSGNGWPEIETACIARSRGVWIGELRVFSPFWGAA